jgi:hypothetical protein
MTALDFNLVQRMRRMARDGLAPSLILRQLHSSLPECNRTKFSLIEYFKDAFCLALRDATPIGGWEAEGSGEISDKRLDELLMPAVIENRGKWDRKEEL